MVDLKELRTMNGFTQSEVAVLVGCTNSAISQYENGHRNIPVDILKRFSEIYGVSVDFIISGDEEKERPLSEDEIEFIELFRQADARAKSDVYVLMMANAQRKFL